MSVKFPNYTGPHGELFDAQYTLFEATIVKFKATLADGFQLKDLADWAPLASDSYDIAKTLFPDGFSKGEVIEVAAYIYWAINPMPFIPVFIEKWLIIDMAIPFAVNSAWDAVEKFKKKVS